jgi:oligopeptide transport system substrate-binding protein
MAVQETEVVASTAEVVEKVATVEQLPTEAEPTGPAPTETPPAQTPEPELEGLWYPLTEEPLTLDLQREYDWLVVRQCIEGLFEYRGDGSIEPTGATDFEVSEDGLVYTIHLRPEAVWSDGEPAVAQHYVDGVIRMLEPEPGVEVLWWVPWVEGAEAFNRGDTSDPATVGVRAVDAHTLEVRFGAPAPSFETELASASSTFSPIRLDLIEEHGERWTEAGNYLCNGAYLLETWDHGDKVVLVRNSTYWNAGAVSIDRITLPIMRDDAIILDMYEKGELHSTGDADLTDEAPRILADPVLSKEVRVLPRAGLHNIGLNTLRPPTDDLRVRKALAFDRRAFLEDATWVPELAPLSCTIPARIMGHQPYGTCGYTYDPEQARALLAEAGYPDGEGFPPLQVSVNAVGWNEDAARTVAAIWEENLGISTEVRPYVGFDEWLDYLDACNGSKEKLAACEFNTYQMGWVMDHGDPQNLLDVVFAPYSPHQRTGWQSERYQELMALAATEFDTAQRAEYYKEADRILCEDEVAIIPMLNYQWSYLVKEGVTFEFPAFGEPLFRHWALP